MPSSSMKIPTAYEDGSGSVGPWVNPAGAYEEGGQVASLVLPGEVWTQPTLTLLGFNFNVPANAIIMGILVEVRHAQSADVGAALILLLNGSVVSEPRSIAVPAVLDWHGVGGATDKWGQLRITPAQVNAQDTGFIYAIGPTSKSSTVQVDGARITVYYMLPGELGIRSARSMARRLEVTRMYEHQDPVVVADIIATGQTTKSKQVLSAVSNKRQRLLIELVSLGAAGNITFKSGTTNLTPRIYFPAAGTQYLGVEIETDGSINMVAVLDAAATAGTPFECSIRSVLK